MDLKKAYYYIICLAALFVLMWGVVDLASASFGLIGSRGSAITLPVEKEGEASLDSYYQRKMLYDRLTDSLARVIFAGLVFAYSRVQVSRLEK